MGSGSTRPGGGRVLGAAAPVVAVDATLLFVVAGAIVAFAAVLWIGQRWRRRMHSALGEGGRLQSALSASRDFERLFRQGAEPVLIVDPVEATILELNRAASELFEAPRDIFVGKPLDAVVDHAAAATDRIRSVAESGSELDLEVAHKGTQRTLQLEIVFKPTSYRGRSAVLCTYRDISSWRRMEQRLTERALHDPLTGLPNRTLFRDRLERALSRLTRHPQAVAVMVVDLDDFKPVNDTLGHAAGDEVLVETARRICDCLRVTDTAARLGGDEFGVLLVDVGHPRDATHVAHRINESLAGPFAVNGRSVQLQASIGVAATSETNTAEDLLAQADMAMYNVKRQGKSHFEVFDHDRHGIALERADLRDDFRQALTLGELLVEYQPILDLRDGRITGVEALVRWEHPERGRIAPGVFIPVAESTGLIGELGEWVIRSACRQGAEWSRTLPGLPLIMSVNVSSRQIRDGDHPLPALIGAALRESGFPGERLVVEITEDSMITNPDTTHNVTRGIRDLGVRIALDDFGTGYSSLRILHHFPVDIVKIDRVFTEAAAPGKAAARMTRAVIALSRELGLETIAEGIGSVEQLVILREMGCELGQGYQLARPMAASEAAALLHAGTVELPPA